MFCLKNALRQAGINAELPASIKRNDLPEICNNLGLQLLGYYSSRKECYDIQKVLEYQKKLDAIPLHVPVIAIYLASGVTGHAEYFDNFQYCPEEKRNGMIIVLD